MSQTILFEFGAVIFVAVSTAVFIYGVTMFRGWQDRDDTAVGAGVPNEGNEPGHHWDRDTAVETPERHPGVRYADAT